MGESNSSPLSIDTPPINPVIANRAGCTHKCPWNCRVSPQNPVIAHQPAGWCGNPSSPRRRPLPASHFSFSTSFPRKKKERPQPLLKSYEIFYRWDTNVLFTATVRLISEDLMLAKMVRMIVSAFLPLTSGSRSCSRASTNSSMTPERVVGSKL